MRSFRKLAMAVGSTVLIGTSISASAQAQVSLPAEKTNAYIGCMNRLSGRAYEARSRYFSWVGKNGPTGKERIIYGTYTIYETADCAADVAKANAIAPHDTELEAAASGYVAAVSVLGPLLKEADDYYTQENYKDDKMAKGKALHPRLVAAWTAFENADDRLSNGIDVIQDREAVQELANIEKSEGRKWRYHIQALMISAKLLARTQSTAKPNIAGITPALSDYETAVKAAEGYASANKDSKIGSSFVGSAKTFLTTAKALMRRVRDNVPYNDGEKMIMNSPGGAWMVEGSPARLTRDYNGLVESYNRSASF
jgi:Protein of unknown function (DUF3829)